MSLFYGVSSKGDADLCIQAVSADIYYSKMIPTAWRYGKVTILVPCKKGQEYKIDSESNVYKIVTRFYYKS